MTLIIIEVVRFCISVLSIDYKKDHRQNANIYIYILDKRKFYFILRTKAKMITDEKLRSTCLRQVMRFLSRLIQSKKKN